MGPSNSDQVEIRKLEAALREAPADVDLRVELASALRQAGRADDALSHCMSVLSAVPDHEGALEEAEEAAKALGQTDKAASFQRLRKALARPAPDSSTRQVVPLRAVRGGRSRVGEDIEAPTLTLDDVGGLDHVKKRLRSAFLAPLANPELRQIYAKSLRGGMLLWGPPGCGKTFLARATAGELGARFIGIGLHDVLDMWLGESERQLHELFEDARRNAPCVLFIDEVDALGRKRSQLRHGPGLREVVVQFLAELDGLQTNNEGVFVLAATNHPWDVDTALRRPGRLDRVLLVLPPDAEAREAILRFHLRDRPLGEVDLAALAAKTDLYSGADLAHVCETAAEFALEDSVETGQVRPIETRDLDRALDEIEPSTLPWLQTARNYAEFGGEGGTYAELLAYTHEKGLG